MTPTKRTFSLASILSLTTGKLLCDFDDMHELAEWIAGHPIWTHEFADEVLWTKLRDAVLSEHPALAGISAKPVTRDNFREHLNRFEMQHGKTLEITRGTWDRKESPLQSLERIAPGKPTISVVVPERGAK